VLDSLLQLLGNTEKVTVIISPSLILIDAKLGKRTAIAIFTPITGIMALKENSSSGEVT
jgi:hypothetical protein